jgi:hypothetical protein
VTGTAHVLHLKPGLPVTAGRLARHYLGFTEGEQRVAQHVAAADRRWSRR